MQASECRVPKNSNERLKKKIFLSDQCKETEENNRMQKTRDLVKKITDTKGTFLSKMGTIKDRNGIDLTEADNIKVSWQEYTEELYKKDLNDPDNHDGVITHLEAAILECKVMWALESTTMNKASGGDRIPSELFQILKDGAVKVLHSIGQHIWKTHQGPQDWKRTIVIPMPKKGNACSSLGGEDPLEKGMATHCSVLAWRSPWTEGPGGLQSMGLQRVRRD